MNTMEENSKHGIGFIAGRISVWFFSCVLLFFAGCRNKEVSPEPLFTLVQNSGINFQNTVTDTKTDNSFFFRNFYNGGGVALGDINNDGKADVVLTSNMGEN